MRAHHHHRFHLPPPPPLFPHLRPPTLILLATPGVASQTPRRFQVCETLRIRSPHHLSASGADAPLYPRPIWRQTGGRGRPSNHRQFQTLY